MAISINQSVFSNQFQAQIDFSNIIDFFEQSPTLVNMLNSMPAGSVGAGVPGGGTFSNFNSGGLTRTITIDPLQVPDTSTGTGEVPDVFATSVAHELGHQTMPNGVAEIIGYNNAYGMVDANGNPVSPSQYAQSGLNSEGVAITAEYVVDKEVAIATGEPLGKAKMRVFASDNIRASSSAEPRAGLRVCGNF